MEYRKVSVVGLGYIGLPTAAVFAANGVEVCGVDVNPYIVDEINRGKIHIVEPGLEDIVSKCVASGLLKASLNAEQSDAFVIAVPTPFNAEREPDLSYIKKAIEMIAPRLECGNLIVLESTSPVGTTETLVEWLKDLRPDLNFPEPSTSGDVFIAYCPERVLPGRVLEELVMNPRIIGGISDDCSTEAVTLYKSFLKSDCTTTNARTAELCKLTENSSRDVNIAFANELSLICDELCVNVWELISLANKHPRVNILKPGPGVGGHCIAVDPWFIISSTPEISKIIKTARLINDGKPQWVIEKVLKVSENYRLDKSVSFGQKVRIACLGLSFKADIDDLRESPALEITNHLSGIEGLEIMAVEPNIGKSCSRLHPQATLVSFIDAVKKADIFLLLVDHEEFKCADPLLFEGKPMIDTRGIYSGVIEVNSL